MTWLTNSMRFGGGVANPDPYWANVVFYLPMLAPGAAPVDASPLARTVTEMGTGQDFVADEGILPGQTAWKVSLSSTASTSTLGLIVPALAGAELDGDFTIEAWFKPTGSVGNPSWIFAQHGTGGTPPRIGARCDVSNSWNKGLGLWDLNGTPWNNSQGQAMPNSNTIPWDGEFVEAGRWQHVCIERSSGTMRLYRDGQPLSWTNTGNSSNFNGALNLGYGSHDLRGYLGPVRVTRGVARFAGAPFVPGFTVDGWMTSTAPDFSGTAAKFWRIRTERNNGAPPRGDECELRTTVGGASINVSAGAKQTWTASSGTAGNAFAGAYGTTRWSSSALPATLTADLRVAFPIRHLRLRADQTNRYPKDFELQYSDNGSSWTAALAVTGSTGWSGDEARSWHVPDVGSHRYWRLLVTATDGTGQPVSLDEMGLGLSADGVNYAMDSRNFGTEDDRNAGGPKWNMFDGIIDTPWGDERCNGTHPHGWFGTRLLSEQTIVEVYYSSLSGATTATPQAGAIERSKDGLRWQTVWTFSGLTTWSSGENKVITKP